MNTNPFNSYAYDETTDFISIREQKEFLGVEDDTFIYFGDGVVDKVPGGGDEPTPPTPTYNLKIMVSGFETGAQAEIYLEPYPDYYQGEVSVKVNYVEIVNKPEWRDDYVYGFLLAQNIKQDSVAVVTLNQERMPELVLSAEFGLNE